MSIWTKAYFFGLNDPPQPYRTGEAFHPFTIETRGEAIELVETDAMGHLGDFGNEISVPNAFGESLALLQAEDRQICLRTQITDPELARSMECVFFFAHRQNHSPHLSIMWPRTTLESWNNNAQAAWIEAILRFGKQASCRLCIMGEELDDTFEDRVVVVDQSLSIDTSCSHAYGSGIDKIWVDDTLGLEIPAELLRDWNASVLHGFCQYLLPT